MAKQTIKVTKKTKTTRRGLASLVSKRRKTRSDKGKKRGSYKKRSV